MRVRMQESAWLCRGSGRAPGCPVRLRSPAASLLVCELEKQEVIVGSV